MKQFLLILAALAFTSSNAFADPTHLGVGFYFGPQCPTCQCAGPGGQPLPAVHSPQLNVSFLDGGNNIGIATLPAGWVESGSYDPDAYSASCSTPNNWSWHGYGTITYNDGAGLSYTGAAKFDIAFADTTQVPLVPSGFRRVCWKQSVQYPNQGACYLQPQKYFIYKLKIQSCTAGHVLTNRFIAVGCDGYTEPVFVNEAPWCQDWNTNLINLTVSGF